MASPVYEKQFIRFAESAIVLETRALTEFTLVVVDTAVFNEPSFIQQATGAGEVMGVLQQDMPAVDLDKATTLTRLATVATSGLLLVASDAANPQDQNDALAVSATGLSSSAGGAVTCNASTPIVRQQVTIGGVAMVLASFN